jgi:hypothetical protein
MKSGEQINGKMSSQSPVVWWYREVNCEVLLNLLPGNVLNSSYEVFEVMFSVYHCSKHRSKK